MKREVRNYIFMGMGFSVILTLILLDLLSTINSLLLKYNSRTQAVNRIFNVDWHEIEIRFFGYGMKNIGFFVDLAIYSIIILIVVMVFLKIYWSVKHDNAN